MFVHVVALFGVPVCPNAKTRLTYQLYVPEIHYVLDESQFAARRLSDAFISQDNTKKVQFCERSS
jgi:hypothetical protein